MAIEAVIFDLDGTLVQTEPAKALAHARTVVEYSGSRIDEGRALAGLQDLYGISETRTAAVLIERFGLAEAVGRRQEELGVETLEEAFLALQRRLYADMLADHEAIRQAQLPHSMALLDEMRQVGLRIGLATMSYRDQVKRILEALHLGEAFEVIVTDEDVQEGKPDPEIYLLAALRLGVEPARCLVIEDTRAGVLSALAAGMRCIAVPTELTHTEVHGAGVLDERWIVDDPALLRTVVQRILDGAAATA
jgi:beta-phosphoglucomutase